MKLTAKEALALTRGNISDILDDVYKNIIEGAKLESTILNYTLKGTKTTFASKIANVLKDEGYEVSMYLRQNNDITLTIQWGNNV